MELVLTNKDFATDEASLKASLSTGSVGGTLVKAADGAKDVYVLATVG